MPAYVMLANWTDQGARQVKDSPKRVDAAKKALHEMGGEFKSLYMTMGDYDLIVIYEAPDDAVAARFTLLLAQMGSVRTRTLKAFPEAAYREIINSLGWLGEAAFVALRQEIEDLIGLDAYYRIEAETVEPAGPSAPG